jgi:hypothetical protein
VQGLSTTHGRHLEVSFHTIKSIFFTFLVFPIPKQYFSINLWSFRDLCVPLRTNGLKTTKYDEKTIIAILPASTAAGSDGRSCGDRG